MKVFYLIPLYVDVKETSVNFRFGFLSPLIVAFGVQTLLFLLVNNSKIKITYKMLLLCQVQLHFPNTLATNESTRYLLVVIVHSRFEMVGFTCSLQLPFQIQMF